MMSRSDVLESLSGEAIDDGIELSLAELCRTCQVPAEHVLELVAEGVIEPIGPDRSRWRFRAVSVRRVWRAQRLNRDLGVNMAGAALALELIDELERLRARVRRLETGR